MRQTSHAGGTNSLRVFSDPFFGDKLTEATKEICNQCGRSVAPGSGWFVNRVPSDFGSVEEARDEHGTPYPEGAWQCYECANDVDIFKHAGYFTRPDIVDMLTNRLGRVPTPEETSACIATLVKDIDNDAEIIGTWVDEQISAWVSQSELDNQSELDKSTLYRGQKPGDGA